MPPPSEVALLLETVAPVSVTLHAMVRIPPPPPFVARQAETVASVRVRVEPVVPLSW